MKYILAVVCGLLVAGLYAVLRLWPLGVQKSFSQHVAQNKRATMFYALLFIITLPPFVWFDVCWLMPTYMLPTSFGVFVTAACVLQVACTLVPEIDLRRTRIHRALAGFSGLFLLPAEWLVFTALPSSNGVRFYFIAGIVLQLLVLLLTARRPERVMTWPLQSAYYAGFFLPLVVLTYAV